MSFVKPKTAIAVMIGIGIALALGALSQRGPADRAQGLVTRGDFFLWSQFDGKLQSVTQVPIYSRISHQTSVLQLAPEGEDVEAGDLLAVFDHAQIEERLASLEKEVILSGHELETLVKVQVPLEREAILADIEKLAFEYNRERAVYERSEELFESELISRHELENRNRLAASMARQLTNLHHRLAMTDTVLHPAQVAKAEASLEAARRQRDLVREQADASSIRSPIRGTVIYVPLHMNGEFRTIREGDLVHRNQAFLQIADMSELVVEFFVPESQIRLIAVGREVVVTPKSYPDVRFSGVVDAMGSMAVSIAGRPSWQKYFSASVRLKETDERLLSNMSVYIQVLSHREDDALLIPRRFVAWRDGTPFCVTGRGGATREQPLKLGPGNHEYFVVLDGVNEGAPLSLPDS